MELVGEGEPGEPALEGNPLLGTGEPAPVSPLLELGTWKTRLREDPLLGTVRTCPSESSPGTGNLENSP
jgi:hypothetical protein